MIKVNTTTGVQINSKGYIQFPDGEIIIFTPDRFDEMCVQYDVNDCIHEVSMEPDELLKQKREKDAKEREERNKKNSKVIRSYKLK